MSDTHENPLHDADEEHAAMPMPHGSDEGTPPVDGALPMPHEGTDEPPVDGALPMPHGDQDEAGLPPVDGALPMPHGTDEGTGPA